MFAVPSSSCAFNLIDYLIYMWSLQLCIYAERFLRGILQFVYFRRAELYQGFKGIVYVLNQLNMRC